MIAGDDVNYIHGRTDLRWAVEGDYRTLIALLLMEAALYDGG